MFPYHEEKPKTGKHSWNSRGYSDEEEKSNHNEDSEESSFEQYRESMKLGDLNKVKLSIKMVTEEMIENMFHYYSNQDYQKYQQIRSKNRKVVNEEQGRDGKITRTYQDGGK